MNALLKKSIALYQDGMPGHKIVKLTGVGKTTLYKNLREFGITRSNKQNSRRYEIDHTFFGTINTEQKAYWLGFIYADGYIQRPATNSYRVGIAIKDTDIDQLERFKSDTNATYPIHHYVANSYGEEAPYVRIIISSDQMFHDLQTKGAVERKSLVLTFPGTNIVPQHLTHHFIRGYFDGDGSFAKSGDGFYTHKVCGTQEFLTKMCDQIGHPGASLYQRRKNGRNNWATSIGGRRQVLAIAEWMYRDATVFMPRKHKRYLQMKNKVKHTDNNSDSICSTTVHP